MSYDTVEAGLLTLIQGISGYSSTNAARGDYRVLGKGVTKAVILMPGSVPTREVVAARRRISTHWQILIELYIPFKDEVSTASNDIKVARQAIMDHIDKYPTLNRVIGVTHALIASAREPELWTGESRNWWRQVMVCNVIEIVTTTIVESP